MIVTVEDRTSYFLSKLEAMWPNRLALSVKETAETLNVMLGVKNGTGADELVRRALKSGRLIPGLGRPAGRHWRIPLYDLAYHFGQGFQPGDLTTATKLASAKRTRGVSKQATTFPTQPSQPIKRRGRAAILPSTSFLEEKGILRLHADGETESWQWAPDSEPAVAPQFETEVQQKRHQDQWERTQQIWNEVARELSVIMASERAAYAESQPKPSKRRRATDHRT
jgi:hypothetical protein